LPCMSRGLLKTFELVRSYSVPIRDDRISKLITWYVKALQKAIDLIWDNIEWGYSFLKIVGRARVLTVIMGLKIRIPMIPRDKVFKKMFRDMLMRDNPYASHWVDAIIRTAYSIIENWRRYLRGRGRKIKPKIRRRFARCKITLMKIDYEARTIRITLKPGNISPYHGDQRGSSTGLGAGLLVRL